MGLSDEGLGQARAAGRALARGFVEAVHFSPLERTRRTAEAIAVACGAPLVEAPALTEIDFGDWNGRDFADLEPLGEWRDWNARRDVVRPPGGERMAEVQDRLSRWLDELKADAAAGEVVGVSHQDVIKAAVCQALGLSLRRHAAFEVSPGSITTLVGEPGGWRVLRLNETAHV